MTTPEALLNELHALLLTDVDAYRRRIADMYVEQPEVFESVVLHHKAELEEAARAEDLENIPYMPPEERRDVFRKLSTPDGYQRRYSSIEGLIALRPKDYGRSVARIRLSSSPPQSMPVPKKAGGRG